MCIRDRGCRTCCDQHIPNDTVCDVQQWRVGLCTVDKFCNGARQYVSASAAKQLCAANGFYLRITASWNQLHSSANHNNHGAATGSELLGDNAKLRFALYADDATGFCALDSTDLCRARFRHGKRDLSGSTASRLSGPAIAGLSAARL